MFDEARHHSRRATELIEATIRCQQQAASRSSAQHFVIETSEVGKIARLQRAAQIFRTQTDSELDLLRTLSELRWILPPDQVLSCHQEAVQVAKLAGLDPETLVELNPFPEFVRELLTRDRTSEALAAALENRNFVAKICFEDRSGESTEAQLDAADLLSRTFVADLKPDAAIQLIDESVDQLYARSVPSATRSKKMGSLIRRRLELTQADDREVYAKQLADDHVLPSISSDKKNRLAGLVYATFKMLAYDDISSEILAKMESSSDGVQDSFWKGGCGAVPNGRKGLGNGRLRSKNRFSYPKVTGNGLGGACILHRRGPSTGRRSIFTHHGTRID